MKNASAFRVALGVALFGAVGLAALRAETVTVTTNTQVGATNTQYDGADLIVDAATLTIDGRHSFASLTLRNAAKLTHLPVSDAGFAGIDLIVTGTVNIAAGCSIDVTGKGYPANRTVGNTTTGASALASGGSHGGLGRRGGSADARAWVYGDFRDPQYPGGGGGEASKGGAGGGIVRLQAAALVLDGTIVADGNPGSTHWTGTGGGGAGGGIRLQVGTLSGAGTIAARGGKSTINLDGGGAGGGGRIALLYQTLSGFTLEQLTAVGGTGGQGPGAAGTIYARQGTGAGHLWIASRGTTLGEFTPLGLGTEAHVDVEHLHVDGSTAVAAQAGAGWIAALSVTLTNGAKITHQAATATEVFALDLRVAQTLSIDASSSINVDGSGYMAGRTDGNATVGASKGNCGGSHGGLGRDVDPADIYGNTPNWIYGSFRLPVALGSGGANVDKGGRGGGRIRIEADTLALAGSITAGGTSGWSHWTGVGGSGSGGSIIIDARDLRGAGRISANGGDGVLGADGNVCSGGGGRVAVYYDTFTGFESSQVEALGGVGGGGAGGPGTVYLARTGVPAELRIDDHGRTQQARTPLGLAGDEAVEVERLVLSGASVEVVPAFNLPIRAGRMDILNGARLSHLPCTTTQEYRLELQVADTLAIASGSGIDVDGRGYLGGYTRGNSTTGASTVVSGGSHGGLGRAAANEVPNWVYGDFKEPITQGSGGATVGRAGSGGGVAAIVAGSLQIDGFIRSTGLVGTAHWTGAGGSGSGGSVWLNVGTLSGSGVISANGGPGLAGSTIGSGGGGRVAVHYTTASGYDLESIQAVGGLGGGGPGAAGTVWLQPDDATGTLRIDDQGLALGAFTPFGESDAAAISVGHLVVDGPAAVAVPAADVPVLAESVTLIRGGKLSHRACSATETFELDLRVNGTVQIDALSAIDVTGKGYLMARTLENSLEGAAMGRSGGSHGGLGVEKSGAATNARYGDPVYPIIPGSGAGPVVDLAGAGGGVVRLVAQDVVVDGAIRADGKAGLPGYYGSGGGGAGGSIALNVGVLRGAGAVTAAGGVGGGNDAGSGGGGRVAVHCWQSLQMAASSITARGGTAAGGNGGAGTVVLNTAPLLHWLEESPILAHGLCTIEAAALAVDPAMVRLRLVLVADAQRWTITADTPATTVAWNTIGVADGWYALEGSLLDAAGAVIAADSIPVLVQNSATWHVGRVNGSETWASGSIHIIEGVLIVPAGAVVTVQAGAVVKAAPGARVLVQNGGAFRVESASGLPAVITSLLDDSTGGDTNLDGPDSIPAAGDWRGFSVDTGGTLDLSPLAVVRFLSLRHGGIVGTSQTWMGGAVHVVDSDLQVSDGVTLTILPGAVVKLQRAGAMVIKTGGRLVAHGELAQPIVFTSACDDAHGGDTNRDGTASTPAAGDWRWIYAEGGELDLEHVHILYGGKPAGTQWETTGALRVQGSAKAKLVNGIIRDAFYDGALAYPGGTLELVSTVIADCDRGVNADGAAQVSLLNCTLDANRIGVWGHGGTLTLTNTIVSHSIESGIDNILNSPITIRFCDVWSATGTNFQRMTNPTGTNGTISANPRYRDPARRTWRLGFGSPAIDAADSVLAPIRDILGAPRYDDPRVANTGTATSGDVFADMGAYEFVEDAESDIDLRVVAVTGPATATAGDLVEITWTVRNLGTGTATGPWHDMLGLTLPGGEGWIPVSTVLSGNGAALGPGQSLVCSAVVRVPGGTPAAYHWTVRVNAGGELFEGADATNNTTAATTSVALDVPELVVDGPPSTGTFSVAACDNWFRFRSGSGSDVQVTLETPGAATAKPRLWASSGALPAMSSFDLRSDGGTSPTAIMCPAADGQTWYVLARAEGLSGADSATFSIRARSAGFALDAVAPSRVGTAGPVTLQISGSGLARDTVCELVGAGGTVAATRVFFGDATRLYPTFDLQGRSPGVYSVRLGGAGSSAVLTGAVTVVAGSPGRLEVRLSPPAAMRAARPTSVDLVYRNSGDTDIVAPLLGLSTSGGSFEPWLGQRHVIMFLGISPDGPAGILRPGTERWIPVSLVADDGATAVDLVVRGADMAETQHLVPWDAMKASLRPGAVTSEGWTLVWDNLRALVGTRLVDLNRALAGVADRLSEFGIRTSDAQRLMGVLLSDAGLEAIQNRCSIGAFGRGRWADWQMIATEDPVNGHVTVRRSNSLRLFRHVDADYRLVLDEGAGFRIERSPYEGYESLPGDPGLLARNTDGSFTLREADGGLVRFGTDGNWREIEDHLGRRITATYDSGRLTAVTYPDGEQVVVTWNAAGLVANITAPVGGTTTFTYDSAGPYLSEASGDSGILRFEYTGTTGNARHAPAAVESPDGTSTYFDYDAMGRLSGLSSEGGLEAVSYEYASPAGVVVRDGLGPPIEVYWTDRGTPGRIRAQSGTAVDFAYDANGWLSRVHGPDGLWWRYEKDADGNLRAVTDGNGSTRRFAHSAHGELESAWDGNGNLVALSRPSPSTVEEVRADGTRTRYDADYLDRITRRVDRMGRTTDYTWSPQGVLETIARPLAGETTLSYDAQHRLSAVETTAGRLEVERDAAGAITKIIYPGGRWIAYTYGLGGRRTKVSTSDGHEVNYSYDALGRLDRLSDGAGQTIVACSFDIAGRITEKRYGNGTVETFTFHPEGYPASIVLRSGSGSLLEEVRYTWDIAGRVHTRSASDGDWTYAYDAAGQLVRAARAGGPVHTYTYDAAGNRVATSVDGVTTAWTVNGLNQYTNAGTRHLTYDGNGNVLTITGTGGARSFTYDEEDRLVSADGPDGAWEFEYDALGNLAAVTRDGVRTAFLVDPLGGSSIVAEYDAAGNPLAHYVGGLGPVMRETAAGARTYFGHDLTGNALLSTNAAGAVTHRHAYDPFGGGSGAPADPGDWFRFGGRHGMMSFGPDLVFVRRRFYCPSLGRFLSEDRLPPDGTNLYAYAANDPVNKTDVNGLEDVNPVIEELLYMLNMRKQVKSGDFNASEEFVTKTLGTGQKLLDWIADLRAKDVEYIESLRFKARLAQWVEGNPARSKALSQLADRLKAVAPSERVTSFLKGAAGVLDKGLKGYTVIKSLSTTYSSVQDWRNGEKHWSDAACDVGKAVGDVIGTFNPVLGACFTAFDLLTDWAYDKYFEYTAEARRLAETRVRLVTPIDPNEIQGPAGVGADGWIPSGSWLGYTVRFENDPKQATAAAQIVRVTHTLDPGLDAATLELGAIGFGDRVVPLPSGLRDYATRVDLRPAMNLLVDIAIAFDPATRTITWTFTSLDPVTSRLTEDPLAGFLPPNRIKPEGEGYVSFHVRTLADMLAGRIEARASIVFDVNAPIVTNTHVNRVDGSAPTAAVSALPAVTGGSRMRVSWTGGDGDSGVATYNLYVSIDGGSFTLWLVGTTLTTAQYQGAIGHSYAFAAQAVDLVGNAPPPPTAAQASTTTGRPARLVNISTRGFNGTGADAMIVGFAIQPGAASSTPKNLLLRGVGPELRRFHVPTPLIDPWLDLHNAGGSIITGNNDWGDGPGAAQLPVEFSRLRAFGLQAGSRDAALLLQLAPAIYTARVTGADNGTGIALVEAYDADTSFSDEAVPRLVNLSTRGYVGTGDELLIAGFVISGDVPKSLLIRAVGPTLGGAPYNVPGVIADPFVRLADVNGATVFDNDDWSHAPDPALITEVSRRVGAFRLPTNSKDAVMIVVLPPGSYTALVSGVDNGTGIALVELYDADP